MAPSAAESLGNQAQMQAALDAGLNLLSEQQQVVFTQYQRFALAADGFVFWVATPTTMTATGVLHYATDRVQDADATYGANHVLLTSESEVTQFNAVAPSVMWVGSWPIAGGALQIAFSQRGSYFRETNLWHYAGFAVYPTLAAQMLFSPADLPAGPIVSNSLPIWLAQTDVNGQTVPVYPAFLVPENLAPPYIVADVDPQSTTPLANFPSIGPWPGRTVPNSGDAPFHALASWQQVRDQVTLTLYGFDNAMALGYLAGLIDASWADNAPFGFASSPVVRDEHRPQAEITALAQKKTLSFAANYTQGSADAVLRRLILSAMIGPIGIVGGNQILLTGAGTQALQNASAQGIVALPMQGEATQAAQNVSSSAVVS